ncbi:MAG: glycogen debranching enzyme GlgX, partial [Candidatus Obscuribacterales bacterium]|nr:glycogen debranching enzyme GlgX [Steroidobacteraceae bacterium]
MSTEPVEVTDFEACTLQPGEPAPLGATWSDAGVNFAVHCGSAERVELCIFDAQGVREKTRVALPEITDGVAHGFLPSPTGKPGLIYGYRVHGAFEPPRGLRYNAQKLLIDPYAKSLVGEFAWHESLFGFAGDEAEDRINAQDSAPYTYKSAVIDTQFPWEGDRPPAIPWRDSVIYELHVKGFTQHHPNVPERLRGKYLGLAQPSVLAYLKQLGVTAVELLPVQAFVSERETLSRGLSNYWGYNPIAYFAPAPNYAISDPVNEFKRMVKALHSAGIEVILDVVFNHTAEGNERGPTLSLKGFDNAGYYRLDPHQPRHYQDRSGCGNTIAIGHSVTRQL